MKTWDIDTIVRDIIKEHTSKNINYIEDYLTFSDLDIDSVEIFKILDKIELTLNKPIQIAFSESMPIGVFISYVETQYQT